MKWHNWIVGYCLMLCTTGVSTKALGQHFVQRHFGIEDGLPSNLVYAVLQDQKGFMWFATDNGVSRYDGLEFKNFSSANGLPDNEIVNFAEDNLGRIWLSCYNGIPCFIQEGKVYSPANNPELKKLGQFGYMRFCKIGARLIVTREGTNINGFEVGEHGQIQSIASNGNFAEAGNYMVDLPELQNGRILLFNSRCVKIDSFVYVKKSNPISKTVRYCSWGPNSFALVFKDNTCLTYSIVANKITFRKRFKLKMTIEQIYNFDGDLWVLVKDEGIVPIDKQFKQDARTIRLFSGKLVHFAMQDKAHNFWACSSGDGVFMTRLNDCIIYNESHGIQASAIQKISSDDKYVYFGYNNSTIQCINNRQVKDIVRSFKDAPQARMQCLFIDSNYVFFSALDKTMLLNRKTGEGKIIEIGSVKCGTKARAGTLWVGTHSNCYQLKFPDTIIDRIKCGRTTALLERKNGQLIIGTLHGLLVCRKVSGKWLVDTMKAGLDLQELSISCLAELKDILVVGTTQKGLLLLQGKDYEFVQHATMLKDLNCKTVQIDEQNRIWLSSFSGLHCIRIGKSIHQYSIQDYGKLMGFRNLFINDAAVKKDTAYVASSQGLIVFDVNKLGQQNQAAWPVYITELLVNDSNLIKPSLSNYLLRANTKAVAFRFSAIDFESLGNIVFRYRLLGLNDEWQTTNETSIRYEALAPGNYTFQVKAMNARHQWTEQTALISFSIARHWWQSIWFWSAIAFLGLFISFWVIRWFLYHKHEGQLKEASIKKHIAEIELKAIKAQINPHFIFNILNTIQYFVANDQTEKAEDYLGKLGRLLRKTLDFSSKTLVNLEEEVDFIQNYLSLEQLRFDEHFHFRIQNDFSKYWAGIQFPPMVIQPHIENALRHGFRGRVKEDKKLNIRFVRMDDALICEIEDNGIGRKAAKEQQATFDRGHISKGVELSQSKLALFEEMTGKKVKSEIIDLYEDLHPKGTLVRITIKL